MYDTRMQEVVATVRVGRSPVGAGAAPGGDRVYVTNELSDTVSVIDARTYSTLATVPMGLHPFGVAVVGSRAYVTNFGADTYRLGRVGVAGRARFHPFTPAGRCESAPGGAVGRRSATRTASRGLLSGREVLPTRRPGWLLDCGRLDDETGDLGGS
ncbi:YncE family protein [Amycolatopsis echigonensis]|uniref:YncE family protein n=1 Tax=Amycolatopsis echigonensis TaxID=2576905 RepID=UPI001FC9323E|nr:MULTISPECIES: hypothetical protein [Amycolatopsis]